MPRYHVLPDTDEDDNGSIRILEENNDLSISIAFNVTLLPMRN
jgi:hypothetical protein